MGKKQCGGLFINWITMPVNTPREEVTVEMGENAQNVQLKSWHGIGDWRQCDFPANFANKILQGKIRSEKI